MTTDINDRPKYACPYCGSAEVRGDFDAYPVFLADGDKLVYLRSETTDAGVLELYCNSCHDLITDDLDDVEFE